MLTSFQHDAVENAASATRVMGLPAIKVGYRRGSAEARDGVDTWAVETAEKVRAARGRAGSEDSVHGALRTIREIVLTYLRTPQPPGRSGRGAPAGGGDGKPLAAGGAGRRNGATSSRADGPPIDPSRRRGPATSRSGRSAHFGPRRRRSPDDGPANAWKALRRLERLDGFTLTGEESSCLEEASDVAPDTAAGVDLLARLGSTKDTLIDRLQPSDDGAAGPRVHADVESMVNRVVDALTERARETAPGADIATDEWLADLENDPVAIRDTVRHYSMVLAATCQQSVSRSMADAKGREDTVFRTVIVDEAARSNPLDLLIPMACAERRIVLVGDHRQLPHLLEQDVEREIERSAQEKTGAALRQSLFERLFVELREREKRDGVRRTVTLSTQYRMHPLLGKVVSEQFYAPHGEGFDSGRGEEEFAHDVVLNSNVSLAGKVAAVDRRAARPRRRASGPQQAASVRGTPGCGGGARGGDAASPSSASGSSPSMQHSATRSWRRWALPASASRSRTTKAGIEFGTSGAGPATAGSGFGSAASMRSRARSSTSSSCP